MNDDVYKFHVPHFRIMNLSNSFFVGQLARCIGVFGVYRSIGD